MRIDPFYWEFPLIYEFELQKRETAMAISLVPLVLVALQIFF